MNIHSDLPRRTIHVLREEVARKIAAGEVIDRPYSVVRELVDNALDSGASKIEVALEEGGVASITVTDNGVGMPPDDLSLCYLSHATSKISHEDDLLRVRTLGFRGEALSSISAISRLSIWSNAREKSEGHEVRIEGGAASPLHRVSWPGGTRVRVEDLFFNLPGRKKFLRRAATEATLCKTTFIEKSLPFPEKEFIFTTNNQQKLHFLPQKGDQNLVYRVLEAFPDLGSPPLFNQLGGRGSDFQFKIVAGSPGVIRRDRKLLQVYVNNRRISEYSLIQALEYGYQGFLPGGSFPAVFLFLEVDPASVDFNIHPAKREARFQNLQEIHHLVSRTLQDHHMRSARKTLYSQQRAAQPDLNLRTTPIAYPIRPSAEFTRHQAETTAESPDLPTLLPTLGRSYRFLGQLFRLFLVVEEGDRLLLIDQHAAHEKILFDNHRKAPVFQRLLVPFVVELEPSNNQAPGLFLELKGLGFEGTQEGSTIEFTKIPSLLAGQEKVLVEFFHSFRGNVEDIERNLYARMSCRAAIMDGDPLEDNKALEIIDRVMTMENPRCPHGRPIWFELTREELFRFVGRT